MVSLSSPEALFNKQKVFRISGNVENIPLQQDRCRIVVVYEAGAAGLPPALKETADKIVLACKFKMEEAVYINGSAAGDISLGVLQNRYSPEMVLVFGDVLLGKNMPKFKKQVPYQLGGLNVLCASNLEMLDKNPGEKKLLWGLLQQILKLK